MRILPRDEECEKRVLGTILSERDTIYEVRDILTENCFYNDFHKQIYRTVLEITDSGGRADAVSVKSKLEFSYPDFSLYELVKISGMYTFDLYQYACKWLSTMRLAPFLGEQVSMYSPPNRTYSSPSIRLSVVIVSLFLSMNIVITFLAYCDCLSLSGNHEFLPWFFAFQIFELTDVYHFKIVLRSTIFTFMGF